MFRKVVKSMNTYEIIKELSKEKKISIRQLEMKFGYSNGYLAKWKNNTPNADELSKLADYFEVSVDYLLGRTDNKYGGLDGKQKKLTVEEALKSVMSYDGKEVTDNDREILKSIIEAYLDKK